MKLLQRNSSKGFTLIELLVVIGILAVLLTLVLAAINPARQFAQANNTKRRSDVNALLNAIHQYAADNKGALPTGITTDALDVKSAGGGADICTALVTTYIASMPVDPTTGSYTDCTTYDSKYTVIKLANGRVTIAAPDAEISESINVTR